MKRSSRNTSNRVQTVNVCCWFGCLTASLVTVMSGCGYSPQIDWSLNNERATPVVSLHTAAIVQDSAIVTPVRFKTEPARTKLHGRWVGRSPDGTNQIELEFQADGKVLWSLTPATGERGLLKGRFEDSGDLLEGKLRLLELDRPCFQDFHFDGRYRFESTNVLRLDGNFQPNTVKPASPPTFGPHAVRLFRFGAEKH